MRAYIIDPAARTIEETVLSGTEKKRLGEIVEIIASEEFHITFIYPTEYRTCTAYMGLVKRGAPFFRVKGFVDKVKFGKTVIVDKTATGYPKSDKVTLDELRVMISFHSK